MAVAENEKVVWASIRNIHYVYVVVPQPRALGGMNSTLFQPVKNVPNAYVCTLGAGRAGEIHPNFKNELCRVYNQPEQIWMAKDDIKNADYLEHDKSFSSLDIKPPTSFWAFAERLASLTRGYCNSRMELMPEYIKGKQDSVAYINTLLKIAGVSAARRMQGAGTGLPHQHLINEAYFTDPDSIAPDKSRIPLDPNAKNPPGMPKLLPGQKIHNVVSGDWLSKIAQRYYGDIMKYKALYDWQDNLNGNWNRKEIGSNPDLIEVGMRIIIPPAEQIR